MHAIIDDLDEPVCTSRADLDAFSIVPAPPYCSIEQTEFSVKISAIALSGDRIYIVGSPEWCLYKKCARWGNEIGMGIDV